MELSKRSLQNQYGRKQKMDLSVSERLEMEHRRGVLDRLYRGDDHDPALEAVAFPSPNNIECVKWFDARLLGQFRRTGLTTRADRSRLPPALPSNDQAARIEQQGVERKEEQNKK